MQYVHIDAQAEDWADLADINARKALWLAGLAFLAWYQNVESLLNQTQKDATVVSKISEQLCRETVLNVACWT